MSEDLATSTLAPFIVRKLDALGSDPSKADLDALHKLLDTVPPERVVSDEEVQELKNLEKKTLGNQKEYKKETENMKKRTKFTILFCMLFPLLFILSIIMAENLPEYGFFGKCIILMTFWPIKLIAVVILFHFCGFDLQPEVSENDDDDDEDWQYSMTSTELQSKQKALVNRWEQLKTDRKGNLVSQILFDIAFFINLLYYFIRVAVLHVFIVEESNSFSSLSFLTEPRVIFFFIEYIFSINIALLFYVPFWANVIQIITFKKNLVSKLQDRFEQVNKKCNSSK